MLPGPLMLGIAGTTLLGEEVERLRHPAVGGVLLFKRNYQNPQQLSDLTAEIRALRQPPLLIAVDQEGGRVQRFRTGFTELPSARALAQDYAQSAQQALAETTATAQTMAKELLGCGIDLSFAPVLDIDYGISSVIGDRSFGSTPEQVSALALAWQRGVRAAGMVCVGKHFPGHGGVAPDSHHATAVDNRSLEDLRQQDMIPFRRMIDNQLAAIMMSHVVFPNIDPVPAGFSARWLQLLRRELQFNGAVFSDDLEMEGAASAGNLMERIKAALGAGCDMAIVGNTGREIDRYLSHIPSPSPESSLRLVRLHAKV
ncbi:beta-N-acetylhexosaminidase [Spiribacter salilacus]|uniref:beta-N-acetylhexosaminidase n=1 Tax=Spiribacter salilacus TaxID=2664894 RepID=UPI0020A6435D|nr:beta-N-acetylhexosaminidase [Spiribacter salilacus]